MPRMPPKRRGPPGPSATADPHGSQHRGLAEQQEQGLGPDRRPFLRPSPVAASARAINNATPGRDQDRNQAQASRVAARVQANEKACAEVNDGPVSAPERRPGPAGIPAGNARGGAHRDGRSRGNRRRGGSTGRARRSPRRRNAEARRIEHSPRSSRRKSPRGSRRGGSALRRRSGIAGVSRSGVRVRGVRDEPPG